MVATSKTGGVLIVYKGFNKRIGISIQYVMM
uniref:Uncharacterized protein n=1 Tax=Anguilla anguilla TaxID=7936 RepID=A0A0E9PS71_ANGAN